MTAATEPTTDTTAAEAEQWLDALLAQDREGRIRMARVAVIKSADLERGQQCWMGNHDERLQAADDQRRSMVDALEDLRTNGIPEMSEAGRSAAKAVATRLARIAQIEGWWA